MAYRLNVTPITQNPAGKPSPVCESCGRLRPLCVCERPGDALPVGEELRAA